VEVVGEVVILVTSILAVSLVLTYVTVTYSNYAGYITAHGELANIVLEAYGYPVNGSTVIILGNLGRVNAYVAEAYALGNSSTPISLSNVKEYLSYTSPQASNPVTIDGRLLLEPGHMAIAVVKGTYWGVSVEACPTPTSNTCGWVMLKWSTSTYTSANSTLTQGQLGPVNVGSVTIEVTNDTLGIPWVVTVTINGPGGYTYSKGGSGDLTWVQALANSLQTLDTSISLVNQSGYAGGLSIYQLGDSTYGCVAKPRGYVNVTSGVVKYTVNCYRLPTSQVTIIAYYSGPGPAELTLDPTWMLVNGWNKFTLETTPGPHELSYVANGVCWFNGTLTGSSGSVEVKVPNSTYTILVSLICGESPFYVNAHVEDNLTTGSGGAYYMIYTGDANHHVFDEASGSTSQWFRLRLPGLSGYVWGVVTGRVPSQYAECYLYNASLPGIGSNPPEYPVSNGSVIELYIHCTPGSGVVYWVVNVQGSFNYNGEWILTDSYGHEAVGMSSASGSFSVNGADTLSISILKWGSINCQITSPSQQTVNPGQTAVFNIACTSNSGSSGGSGGGSGGSGGSSPTPTSTTTSSGGGGGGSGGSGGGSGGGLGGSGGSGGGGSGGSSSTTSTPPPTSPTTTFTSGTPVTVPTTTGAAEGCVSGNVAIGQAGVFECYFAWNGYTPLSITAGGAAYGLLATETGTLYYMQGGGGPYPVAVAGQWSIVGHCPMGWTATASISGGNINQPLSGYVTVASYTWWVTVSAYCQPGSGFGAQFAFFSTWNPPEIPLTWLLRGGTNTLAPLEPLYLEAWNEYVSMWLAENGFALDFLILLALIMPVLVRPASRRLKLT